MDESRRLRGGLVGPVILIAAGIVLLLNNLGIVPWDIWLTLLRLWPVLLIAIGLDILIGRKSLVGSLVVVLLLLGVLGLVIAGAIPDAAVMASASVDEVVTINQELAGATQAAVSIEFGTGGLLLAALPQGSGNLLSGTADLSRNEELLVDRSGSGDRTKLSVRSEGAWSVGTQAFAGEGKQWDLELNRDIPIGLDVSTGVGVSTLDLSQLQLSSLTVNGGVGSVTVKLPSSGRYNVRVDGGIGGMTVIVPEGVGARVAVDGGLGSVAAEGDFTERNSVYINSEYAEAESRVDISVDGGLGRLVVRQVSE